MKTVLIAVVLLVLLGGGFLIFKSQQQPTVSSPAPQANQPTSKMQYVLKTLKKVLILRAIPRLMVQFWQEYLLMW